MENISKIVVSKKEGCVVGFVLDVAVDFEKLERVGYYVVDEESQSVHLLKDENVIEKGKDVVLVAGVEVMEFCGMAHETLFGKRVISEDGEELGIVKRVELFRKKISKVSTQKCEILAKYISFVGQDVLFVNFKKRRKTVKRSRPVEVLSEDELPKIEILSAKQSQIEKPEKINLSMQYYVGKICRHDVIGQNNERVAMKGEVVTKNVFEKAKKHNRINQLFFSINRERE